MEKHYLPTTVTNQLKPKIRAYGKWRRVAPIEIDDCVTRGSRIDAQKNPLFTKILLLCFNFYIRGTGEVANARFRHHFAVERHMFSRGISGMT